MPGVHDLDLERCSTASITQYPTSQSAFSHKAARDCAIAIQLLERQAFLINVTVQEEVNGDLIFSSAKKTISQVIPKSWYHRVLGRLFMNLVVGTARIKQIIYYYPRPSSPAHEAPPTPPRRVYLEDFKLDRLLTEALHNPHILLRTACYPLNVDSLGSSRAESETTLVYQPVLLNNNVSSSPADSNDTLVHQPVPLNDDIISLPAESDKTLVHQPVPPLAHDVSSPPPEYVDPLTHQPTSSSTAVNSISTNSCIGHDNQEIIVVKQVIDKGKIAQLLILLLLLSPAVGIIVGVCSHNTEAGIAVSAGVFALATFVQGFVAWMHG